MKQQMTLPELAKAVQHIADTKKDFIADTRQMWIEPREEDGKKVGIDLTIDGIDGEFQLKELSHKQIAADIQTAINGKGFTGYAETLRRRGEWEILAYNLNQHFMRSPRKRMVRTLDDAVRAYLSERYRILDGSDLLVAFMPAIHEIPGLEILSTGLTDENLYLKMVYPTMEAEIRKGDIIQAGFSLSNSDVGLGAVTVKPLIYTLWCLNGAIIEEGGRRALHLGGRHGGDDDEAHEYFETDTRRKMNEATFLQMRDTMKNILTPAVFQRTVQKMRSATEKTIEGDPIKAVEVLANQNTFTQAEHNAVLTALIESKDMTLYGLTNAVTLASQQVPSYQRATDLEVLGGKLLDLTQSEWKVISTAA